MAQAIRHGIFILPIDDFRKTNITAVVIKINKGRIKLKDVARMAGVSVGTVSRYINNHPKVSKKNAIKIQEAIDKLEYIPNRTAQNLAKGVSNNLLLYMLQENPIQASTWLYELPIIQAILDYIKNTEFSLQLGMNAVEDKKEIDKFLNEYINNRRADGIIILSMYPIDDFWIRKLKDSEIPFVLIGNTSPVAADNQIIFDNYNGIKDIMEYLHDLGHKKIGFINGFEHQQHMIQRKLAFFDNIERLGFITRKEWIKNGDFGINSGFTCMQEILNCKEQPTAIVCSNDIMAAGAMQAIKQAGSSVPEDYSITGFDDSLISKVVEPSLTTVKIPLKKMADVAINQIIKKIKDPNIAISNQIFSCSIVIGDSTSKPKADKK